MANVDATFDSYSPMKQHGYFIQTGTIAVTNSANETRIAPATGTVLWCHMENTSDDATGDIRLVLNTEDAFSTASQGLVAHQSEAAADTYRFTAGVRL